MPSCDVLIVGGGPAGSSCARRLVQAGMDVIVLDRAAFPRDKVCAGWITPAAVDALELDLDAYGATHTLQPFTGFQTARISGASRLTDFAQVVSYGIRRCEFDTYLLERSGARLATGQPLRELRRDGDRWVANGTIDAAVVVGAGGHFCPVARQLNGERADTTVVVAQEIEFRMEGDQPARCGVDGERPELFFWPDLRGYGWCVRKGDYLNIGAGHLLTTEFPAAARAFREMLQARGVVPDGVPGGWKGHAYLLHRNSSRPLHGDAVLLVGDAAGLALAPSGEGILAAIESGLIAASTIADLAPSYSETRLREYTRRIEKRFGPRRAPGTQPFDPPRWLASIAGRALLASPWLTRRALIEDGFLHVRRPKLAAVEPEFLSFAS